MSWGHFNTRAVANAATGGKIPGEANPATPFLARLPAARPLVATIFSDHMVLQREKPVPVRGWCQPGWEVPWGIAVASFHPAPEATADKQAAVAEGQKKVISTVPGVFEGPTTDGFRERGFLHDGVHFNAQGLTAHAQGWEMALAKIIGPDSK